MTALDELNLRQRIGRVIHFGIRHAAKESRVQAISIDQEDFKRPDLRDRRSHFHATIECRWFCGHNAFAMVMNTITRDIHLHLRPHVRQPERESRTNDREYARSVEREEPNSGL